MVRSGDPYGPAVRTYDVAPRRTGARWGRTAAVRNGYQPGPRPPDPDKHATASGRAGTVPPLVTWVFSEGWNALERRQGRSGACAGDAEGAARVVLAERLSALREGSGRTSRRWPAASGSAVRRCTGTARVGRCPRSSPRWSGWPGCAAHRPRTGRSCTACGCWRTANAWTGRGWRRSPRAWRARRRRGPGPVRSTRSHRTRCRPGSAPVPALTPAFGFGSGSGSGQSGAVGRRAFRKPPLRSPRARRYGQGLGVLAAAVLVLALVVAFGRPWSSGPDGRTSVAHVPGGPSADSPEPPPSGSPAPGKPHGTASGFSPGITVRRSRADPTARCRSARRTAPPAVRVLEGPGGRAGAVHLDR
ncbi:hypothetical protein SBADM41S_00642 [Streptomyces badius]